jgi:uncharacterized membrane protein YedE/YeeE
MLVIPDPYLLSLLGGVLIGLSATGLLLFNGKIAGISGIVGGLLTPLVPGDRGWRLGFVGGLLAGGAALAATAPALVAITVERSSGALIVAGLLVGFGTRLGSGCTSGHGVCGISRGSKRSIAATLTFITVAGVVTYVVNHRLGGRL